MVPLSVPNRTVLFYPPLLLPTASWMRQACLYWDTIGIVNTPDDEEKQELALFFESVEQPEYQDFALLGEAGVLRLFSLGDLFKPEHKSANEAFEAEALSVMKSKEAARGFLECAIKSPWTVYPRYRKTISEMITGAAIEQTFANECADFVETLVKDKQFVAYVWSQFVLYIYLGLATKYLATLSKDWVIPGTDHPVYESIAYPSPMKWEGQACFDVEFLNALPIPYENVPLPKILKFREKRRNELLQFRTVLDEFFKKLQQATDLGNLRNTVTTFRENIERENHTLDRLLREEKIQRLLGSIKAMINIQVPTLLTKSLELAAKASGKITHVSIGWMAAGLAVSGLINVSYRWIRTSHRMAAELRDAPYAYLYYAKKGGYLG